ncbi:MAG: NADH-quinone oxidoreductase subunit NuoG [Fimbriimonas sp.]
MAAVAGVQLVNISINDIELQVPKGELVVESVKRLGLEVPIFCYHSRMKPVGMCRMCLVEVGMKQPDGTIRKMPKPQTACTLPCSEGLAIYTDSELVHTDRRGVLEFLLINHPLDCPICDRGGECPLQNNTLFYGPSTSRFIEFKRHAPKAFPLSQYVTLDLERCIQCGRCVRFTEEISGDSQLAFRFRGNNMQPSTFQMTDFDSKFSGNVIEICPVGALTNSAYRFRARPWDLQTRPGICTLCSNGCNIYVDYRVGEIVRVNGRTNEAVNEEWTCDRGKFGHYAFNSEERLTTPLIRQGDELVESNWAGAYSEMLKALPGSTAACLAGGTLSNEDYYVLQRVFRTELGSDNLDHRFTKNLPAPDTNPKSTIDSFEDRKSILLFGTSLADEEPILFLRVRKAWFKNSARVIVAHHEPTDADSFAHLILRYRPGTEAIVAAALASGADAAQLEAQTWIRAADFEEARSVLAEDATVVTTRALLNQAEGPRAAETLRNWADANFNQYALEANDEGAALLGIWPQNGGKNTQEILQGCIDGSIKALWLAGVDPFEKHEDKEFVRTALENVEFLVVQHWLETEAVHYASIVLPMVAPAEAEGSYTNLEGRVQRMMQILGELGEAKPAWRVFSELSLRLKPATPYFNPGEIMDAIARDIPTFAGVSYDKLGGEGFLLGKGQDPNGTPPKELEVQTSNG